MLFAANQLYKSNCIVIDFGTATTFDILSKNGIYNGGLIAPGVRLSLSTLSSLTALTAINKAKENKANYRNSCYCSYQFRSLLGLCGND